MHRVAARYRCQVALGQLKRSISSWSDPKCRGRGWPIASPRRHKSLRPRPGEAGSRAPRASPRSSGRATTSRRRLPPSRCGEAASTSETGRPIVVKADGSRVRGRGGRTVEQAIAAARDICRAPLRAAGTSCIRILVGEEAELLRALDGEQRSSVGHQDHNAPSRRQRTQHRKHGPIRPRRCRRPMQQRPWNEISAYVRPCRRRAVQRACSMPD